ncbi:hypothetical protein RJ40_10700 [Methanofollis aquaemaris]|uniref:Polysaccharide biosynthesis protein n=1 Tax=Methanofollis aquaemaris TaxID=126734 RepID=A0A8A3S8B8_9EURY|nr:oligosaccharide flippase family protein [Methanofollis aquaemaris]QSZ67930.1 hypothetical protein RJ40_10700 [Methanofollis aquaemaris]
MFRKRSIPLLDAIVNEIISKIYIIWGRFHERFIENPTYVGFYSILSGSVLGQLVMLLATPIITRLYSPSDFGILSLYTMVVSVLLVFATLKYELAIPLPKENKKAINLMTLCFGLTFGISVISILLIGLIGRVFASETDLSLLSPYLWVISLSIFGGGVYNILNYWAIRDKKYSDIAKTRVNKSVFGSTGKIAFGIFNMAPLGLILGEFIGQITGGLTFLRSFLAKNRQELNCISWKAMVSIAKQYYRFPLYSCPSVLFNTLAFQMPVLMLIRLYGPETVGLYTLANSVLVLPASLISSAASQVYLGEVAQFIHRDPAKVKKYYHAVTRKLAFISLPTISLIAVLAPFFFPLIFGTVWDEAGLYCIALSGMVIAQLIFSPPSILHYCGRNNWVLLFDISRTILTGGVFLLCAMWGYSPLLSLVLYSITMALMYVVNYFMNLKAIACLTKE